MSEIKTFFMTFLLFYNSIHSMEPESLLMSVVVEDIEYKEEKKDDVNTIVYLEEKDVEEVGTAALDYYFKYNTNSLSPHIEKRFKIKLRKEASRKSLRKDFFCIDPLMPSRLRPSDSFNEMDSKLFHMISDSIEESFSEYKEKLDTMEAEIKDHKKKLKKLKKKQKNTVLITNIATGIISTAFYTYVDLYSKD